VCRLIACTREGGRVPCVIYKTLVPRTPPLAFMIVLRVRYFHSQLLLVALPSGATSYSPTKPIVLRSAYFSDVL